MVISLYGYQDILKEFTAGKADHTEGEGMANTEQLTRPCEW